VIAKINRFRNDPRAVAPLAVIALVIVAFAVMKSLPSGPAPQVNVKEVTEVRPPAPTPTATSPSGTNALKSLFESQGDPYYSSRLKDPGQGGIDLSNLSPEERQAMNIQTMNAARMRQMEEGEALPPAPVLNGKPATGVAATVAAAKKIEPEWTPHQMPDLPEYRVSAVLLGTAPLVIFVDPQGGSLYIKNGQRLPTGERLHLISNTRVGLIGPEMSRILDLHGEETP